MRKRDLLKSLIILVFIFLICLLNNELLKVIYPFKGDKYITKIYETANGKIEYPYFRDYGLDKKIKSYVIKLKDVKGNITYKASVVDDEFVSLIFFLPNYQYKSYLISLANLKEENINVIFKFNYQETLTSKINEMLESKYPAFIYNSIIDGKGDMYYLVENNQITIYFANYNITPTPNENFFIKLNYQEIKDLLAINYTLDKEYVNENIYTLDPNKKTIAFTFDDGPNKTTTIKIFNSLNENKASATFFMLGNRLENNQDLVTEILNSTSEVGTHSYSHKYLTKLRAKKRAFNINEPTRIMTELFNTTPVYFRPPYGNLNDKIKSEINMPIILWNVDPEDWKSKDAKTVVNNVLSTVKDGDIVLMHDIFSSTAEAVETLLPELYVRGYQVVSVSKLAALKGVTLEASKAYRHIK